MSNIDASKNLISKKIQTPSIKKYSPRLSKRSVHLNQKSPASTLSKRIFPNLTPQHVPESAPLVPPVSLPRPFKHLIFTYGTLKRNMRNHYRMRKPGIAFAFNAKTVDRFPLFLDPENRHRPSLLDAKGIGHQVLGEVYAVNDIELSYMDQFERVPEHYHRQLYPINPIFDSNFDKEISCYLFSNGDKNFTNPDHVVLAHIYCQNIDTRIKHDFINQLILNSEFSEHFNDKKISTISTLSECSSFSLPPAIKCYGIAEDKLYTPRVLEKSADSATEESHQELQHLSNFFP